MISRIIVAIFLVSFLTNCQSSTIFPGKNAEEQTLNQSVRVFVNGKDRGTTPMTLRIYRGRKELDISLQNGRNEVRTFELEETYSPNAAEIDFSFRGRSDMGTLRLTVEELPSKDDFHFIIPFFQEVVTVEDNQYGLTLIVAD